MRFLIYAGPGIGDTFLVLPLAKAIKENFHHALVDLLICSTSSKAQLNRRLIACLPYIDGLEHYSMSEKLHAAMLLMELRSRHYDYGLVLQYENNKSTSPWPYRVMHFAGIATIGFEPVRDDIRFDFEVAHCPGQHKSIAALSLLSPLGVVADYHGEPLLDPDRYAPFAERVNIPDSSFVGIATGAGQVPFKENGVVRTSSNKDWGVDNWLGLARELRSHGMSVVLLGGKSESLQIEKRELPDGCFNLCGKTSIEQSMGVIAKASCLVSADTGLMHCAGAMGVPTISLFGCTNPDEYAPIGERATVVSSNQWCAPCFGSERSITCDHRDCMRSITVEAVSRSVIIALKS